MKNIYKIPAYVGIILKKENQVLLVQRHENSKWMPGYWNFPGGLLEENETLTAAAAREIREEVGVIVNPTNFTFSHIIQVHANISKLQDILGAYFITEQWDGAPTNCEPDKHSNVAWFDLNDLPEQMTEHALLAINSLKTKTCYYEDGW
jgi:8-oxo-dGTP diphosphatase